MGLNPYNFSQGWDQASNYTPVDTLGSYQKGIQSKLAEQKEQQDLMKKELANIFQKLTNKQEPERHNVAMGLGRAQTGLLGEQTKYYGPKAKADIKAQELANLYNPRIWEGDITKRGYENQLKSYEINEAASNQKMMQDIMRMASGGAPSNAGFMPGSQQNNQSSPNGQYAGMGQRQMGGLPLNGAGLPGLPGGIGVPLFSNSQPNANVSPQAQQATAEGLMPQQRQRLPGETVVKPGNPNLAQFDEAFLNNPAYRKKLEKLFPGTGIKTDDNDITGVTTTTAVLPSGEITKTVTQTKMPQGFTDANIDAYKKNNEELQKSHEANDIVNQLGNLVRDNSKDMESIIGPVNSKVPDIMYSKKKEDLIGQTRDLLGKLVVATARDIKGPYQGAEANLINEFKPNMADDFDVFLGKLKSTGLILQMAAKRKELYGEYLGQNIPAHKAEKMAREQTSFKELRPLLNRQFSRHTMMENSKTGETVQVPSHMKKSINELYDLGFREAKNE